MILNVMENHVTEAFERLKDSVVGFQDNAAHGEDVIVFALNRLPPKYVVGNEGKAVTEALLDSPQQRTAIDIQVIEALRQVTKVPGSMRRPGSASG